MSDTYTVQGRRGTHTRNTVFDNTDPWDYLHHGPQQSSQQHNQTQQQRQQTQQQTQQQQSGQQQPQPQPQPQSQPMSIETLIRNHVRDIREQVINNGDEGRQYNALVLQMTDILNELRSLQSQVSNSNVTTEHAAVIQTNVQELINTVETILNELQQHQHDQGADLVNANRTAETQLVNLVHGFQNQVSLLGVVIFDSVNDSHDTFTVSSSAIRNIDYRRFTINTIATANNNQSVRIGGEWVRPTGTDATTGVPDTWDVYIPSYGNANTKQVSAVLVCELPRRPISAIWRGYGQSVSHASYWGAVRSSVTINVRFSIPLNNPDFANAIDTAYAQNLTNVTYNFISTVDPRASAVNPNHTHTITISGKALSDLYTSIRDAVRRSHDQALAQLYSHLTA
jgi:hypothetical protein